MAGNPNIGLGTLNRLLGSFIVPDYPSLNVTASYLGPRGIAIAPQGPITTRLPQMTGAVPSPEPWVPVIVTINLIKSQALAGTYKEQIESLALIGDCTVRPDATTLPIFNFSNMSIDGVEPAPFDGKDAGFIITIGGNWLVNNDLWSAI